MLVDPSLWATFHQARDALLNALREVPSVNDIWVTPPPIRAIPPASMNSLIQAISEAEREIETAQNELSSIQFYLADSRAIVTNWSSSLAMLPYELMQEIVSYVIVTPGQQRRIMQLSHVSKRWREAVLAMSWLFTTANWNAWPHPLVELWCQRAGTQPLNISLGDQAIDQLRNERGSELMCLLNSCTSRWGELQIHFQNVRLQHRGVAEAVGRLLRGSTPLLHHLNLLTHRRENETTLLVRLYCPPPLNVSLSGVWALFGAGFTPVTDLTLQLSHADRLSRVVDVLNSCPLIRRLKLDLEHYSEGLVDISHTTQTMLPSLVHLELHNIKLKLVTDIGQILRYFDIPNLNSITVATVVPDADLFPLLERAIPNVQCISVLNYSSQHWDRSSYELERLGMQPTIFTHLTELHVLYKRPTYIQRDEFSSIGKAIQDIVCFREGSITHLTTSPFDDNIMELLRGRVPHLKVAVQE